MARTVRAGHSTIQGVNMKTAISALVASLCLAHVASFAADTKAADKPSQQNRMKTCNADAKSKGIKGEERRAFMSECLKAK
jgi:psiF repeat